MLLVAYFGVAPHDATCYACGEPAQYTLLAVNGGIRDFACEDCIADHMVSTAVALNGDEVLARAAA